MEKRESRQVGRTLKFYSAIYAFQEKGLKVHGKSESDISLQTSGKMERKTKP